MGLDGLQLEDKQHLSPLAHRWGSEAESEEDSLLVAEDDPTPGFECIDKAMLRARRQVVLMSRRHRAVLCLAVTAAAWLLFSAPSYLFGRRCSRSRRDMARCQPSCKRRPKAPPAPPRAWRL